MFSSPFFFISSELSVTRLYFTDRLVGLVVRCPPRERKVPGSNPACARIFFSGSSHTSDLKIGIPVATLPGAWRYRVSTGTGRPGVRILWLGEVEHLICNFCLSVAARKIVWADASLRYTHLFAGTLSNQQTNSALQRLPWEQQTWVQFQLVPWIFFLVGSYQ